MRKQLDLRWKQIDKFEASVKTLAEAKALWRKKLSAKEGEIEALQVRFSPHFFIYAILTVIRQATNAALQSHVVSRKGQQGESMEVRSLTARVQTAERRAINLQNQLVAAEEKVTTINQKTATSDSKWEARVAEYEKRLREAQEKVKREKQGGKERALELETQAKYVFIYKFFWQTCTNPPLFRAYQRQIDLAQKRIQTLNEIIETAGLPTKGSPVPGKGSPAGR